MAEIVHRSAGPSFVGGAANIDAEEHIVLLVRFEDNRTGRTGARIGAQEGDTFDYVVYLDMNILDGEMQVHEGIVAYLNRQCCQSFSMHITWRGGLFVNAQSNIKSVSDFQIASR